jgi:hypothetical protein
MADRTEWLKEKVTRSLDVSESLFNELLERQGPDGKTYWEGLNAFFDHEDAAESVVMFYTNEEVIGGAPEGKLHSAARASVGCSSTVNCTRVK